MPSKPCAKRENTWCERNNIPLFLNKIFKYILKGGTFSREREREKEKIKLLYGKVSGNNTGSCRRRRSLSLFCWKDASKCDRKVNVWLFVPFLNRFNFYLIQSKKEIFHFQQSIIGQRLRTRVSVVFHSLIYSLFWILLTFHLTSRLDMVLFLILFLCVWGILIDWGQCRLRFLFGISIEHYDTQLNAAIVEGDQERKLSGIVKNKIVELMLYFI